jgi:hypothetical protein
MRGPGAGRVQVLVRHGRDCANAGTLSANNKSIGNNGFMISLPVEIYPHYIGQHRAALSHKVAGTIVTSSLQGRVGDSHAELHPEVVTLVRQLRRKRPKGGQRSLREISAELAKRGIVKSAGTPSLRPRSARCSAKQ